MARMDQQANPEKVVTKEKKKFGLVLQGAAALGAYEVGAIEYLYESGMECTIVAGASSGAVNAVTLAGAKEYPPKVLRRLWEEAFTVDPPIPFVLPQIMRSWSLFGVPGMYRPRWDYWNLPTWTAFCDTAPTRKTLEEFLDWEQVRDPAHMRVFVSASGVETGETRYFSNLDPNKPLQIEHVMASGSFPPGFPWTMVDHRAYWDGGLTDNTPLKPVIDNLLPGEPETMPIFMIDVFSSSAPLPTNMQQVLLRMAELMVQNKLKADSETAQSYTRFIRVLKAMIQDLPATAQVLTNPEYREDFEKVMNYALVNEIRMIDVMKPAEESAADFSRETILRRISAGYDAVRRELEARPLKSVQQTSAPLTLVPSHEAV
jgi:NTE family protein